MSKLRETDDDKTKVKNNKSNPPSNNEMMKQSSTGSHGSLNNIQESDDMDQNASEMMNKTQDAAKAVKDAPKNVKNAVNNVKNTANKIKNAPKNIKNAPKKIQQNIKKKIQQTKNRIKRVKRRIKQTKEMIKMIARIIKMIIQAIIHLIMALWPVLLAIIISMLIAVLLYNFLNNLSVKGNQFVDAEATVLEYNEVSYDSDSGEYEVTEVTMENKLVRAFYSYYSEKSIWVMTDGTIHTTDGKTENNGISTDGKVLQYRSEKFIKKFKDPSDDKAEQVVDKYGRESQFYINPNALYVLDKYLHNEEFRFPEQLVKHVPYKKMNYTATTATLQGTENEEKCWNFFISAGYSEIQTAGILGNLKLESSYDPNVWSLSHTHFGIAQWGGGRYENFKKFAAEKGVSETELSTQLSFMLKELDGSYYNSLQKAGFFNTSLTVEQAAKIFENCYERSGEQGMDKRTQYAKAAYNKYHKEDTENSTTSKTSTTGTITSGIKDFNNPKYDNVSKNNVLAQNVISDKQKAIQEIAKSNKDKNGNDIPCISQECAKWVRMVYNAAGYTYDGGNAIDYWRKWKSSGSSSSENIPIGAVVVGSGESKAKDGTVYGHVGIYIGNNLVAENIGKHNITSLDKWIARQVMTCDGMTGFIGWVWPNNENSGTGTDGSTAITSSLKDVPYELQQLTNDDGSIAVKSTKYKKKKVTVPTYKEEVTMQISNATGHIGDEVEVIKEKRFDENGKETQIKGKITISEDALKIPYRSGIYSQQYKLKVTKMVKTGEEIKTYLVQTDKKEAGIWDYGFGSIVFYDKYQEATENRGNIVEIDVWDSSVDNGDGTYGKMITMTVDEYKKADNKDGHLQTPYTTEDLKKEIKWNKQTSESYMIKWVVTPAGTVTNDISYTWKDSGVIVRMNSSEDKNVNKKEDKVTLVTKVTETRRTKNLSPGETVTVCTFVDKNGDKTEKNITNEETYTQAIEYEYTYYQKQKKKMTFQANVEGTTWNIEPTYDNDDVDTSKLTGTRYYEDYLDNYVGYIPVDIQTKFNFEEIKERTGKNSEELSKLLENQTFSNDNSLINSDFFDEDGNYIGLGSIQKNFEGDVGTTGDDGAGNYSFGIPQFPPSSCSSFMSWLKKKDSEFYSQYFGGITLEYTKDSDFEKAWKKAAKEEKELFTLYQVSYAYKTDCLGVLNSKEVKNDPVLKEIDFTRSFALQEFVYSTCCIGPKYGKEALLNCGIRTTDSDEEIMRKISQYIFDNASKIWASSYNKIKNGIENRWNPKKSNSQYKKTLAWMKENPNVGGFEFDEETELFVGGAAGYTASSTWFASLLKKLKGFASDIGEFYKKVLTGEDYVDVLESKYWTKMRGIAGVKDNQIDWVLQALFAYEDQARISEYTIDDDYINLRFQDMFSSSINNYGGLSTGVITRYLDNNAVSPLSETKEPKFVREYNKKESPIAIVSTKDKEDIRAVAEGKIIKIGSDITYGGNYVMIQHKHCISIYGNLSNMRFNDGSTVKQGEIIGSAKSTLYFALKTQLRGSYINPMALFDEDALIAIGDTGTVDVGVSGTILYKERMNWLFPTGIPTAPSQMNKYLVTISVPVVNKNGKESTKPLTIHRNLANEVKAIFEEMKEIGFPISDAACYNWRTMNSGTSLSHHSYGVAIDINTSSNPFYKYGINQTGGKYKPGVDPYSVTAEVVKIWKKHGFYWGGDWSSQPDYMHFTYTNH